MPAEQQELMDDVQSIKKILREHQRTLNPLEVSSFYQKNPVQRPWTSATPQVFPGTQPVNQGAVPRSSVCFDPGIFSRSQASRRPVLETVTEKSGLGINIDRRH